MDTVEDEVTGGGADAEARAGAPARRGRGPKRPVDRVQVLLSLVIGLSLVGVVFGFSLATSGSPASAPRDPVLERLVPPPGDLVLRQSTVGADLTLGYRGYLVIDGQEIPTYDVTADQGAAPGQAVNQTYDARFDRNVGSLRFTPTTGATIEKFAPGPHRITVVYWREGVETRDQARSYSWEFSVS